MDHEERGWDNMNWLHLSAVQYPVASPLSEFITSLSIPLETISRHSAILIGGAMLH
jgi:hypothetical protein